MGPQLTTLKLYVNDAALGFSSMMDEGKLFPIPLPVIIVHLPEDAGEFWSIVRFHIKGRLQCVA
jgi:hypothetical protein